MDDDAVAVLQGSHQLLREAVARIETKLDMALAEATDHEERLRKLESHGLMMKGAIILVGACVGVLARVGVHIG